MTKLQVSLTIVNPGKFILPIEGLYMEITQAERDAVYKTIYARRDVRREFNSDPVPDDVIHRIIDAAHHAPSVGFMQPWDFIVVKDPAVRQKIKDGFDVAKEKEAEIYEGEKKKLYQSLKLEGIMEAPLGICITCDRSRTGQTGLGRSTMPEMDLYSSVCAVQTLWLAARAENLGVGWMSIIQPETLRDALRIPEEITVVAYLCVGYVSNFSDKPDLEKAGWLPREDLGKVLHYDGWGKQ